MQYPIYLGEETMQSTFKNDLPKMSLPTQANNSLIQRFNHAISGAIQMKTADWNAIAKAIKENGEYGAHGYFVIAQSYFIRDLCRILKADNPKFNEEKFRELCK